MGCADASRGLMRTARELINAALPNLRLARGGSFEMEIKWAQAY